MQSDPTTFCSSTPPARSPVQTEKTPNTFREQDILLGRGAQYSQNPGNRRFYEGMCHCFLICVTCAHSVLTRSSLSLCFHWDQLSIIQFPITMPLKQSTRKVGSCWASFNDYHLKIAGSWRRTKRMALSLRLRTRMLDKRSLMLYDIASKTSPTRLSCRLLWSRLARTLLATPPFQECKAVVLQTSQLCHRPQVQGKTRKRMVKWRSAPHPSFPTKNSTVWHRMATSFPAVSLLSGTIRNKTMISPKRQAPKMMTSLISLISFHCEEAWRAWLSAKNDGQNYVQYWFIFNLLQSSTR